MGTRRFGDMMMTTTTTAIIIIETMYVCFNKKLFDACIWNIMKCFVPQNNNQNALFNYRFMRYLSIFLKKSSSVRGCPNTVQV